MGRLAYYDLGPKVYADVAKNDKKWEVRLAAVSRLTDPVVLADVVKNDKKWGVRRAAVNNLTDPVVLAEVVRNEGHRRVLDAARERLIELNLNSNP